ncbi:diaboline synthase-like [Coffea arabica]|uniref:Diaboline synthase-like n=1 Tax=Coffea arabica TaxID=13443 RepID=A0A6P6TTV8_COFAR|nr:vinorine synthase-like [Coffea arabica]
MANLKPQMISKVLIKPSLPTSEHLKTYNLSVLDQLSPHFYLPIVLFYPPPDSGNSSNYTTISSHLKKSLSETLTHYYPFAGRLAPNKDSIDCNDEGLDFYEARIECKISDVLKNPDPETMDLFSPPGMLFNESFQGSPFIVQVTYFSCGGTAISVSMLHKVTDACALLGFINDWAALASGSMVSPMFLTQQVISPYKGEITVPGINLDKNINVVTRRFSFKPSKLSDLKAMVSDDLGKIHSPSRVEVVAALIYKCAMAASEAKSGMSRPSMLMQAANMRPRVVPPLPDNCAGNFSWFFSITTNDEKDKNMTTIISALKKAAQGFSEKFGNGLSADNCYSLICESIEGARKVMRQNQGEIEVYRCSSLCRYPFNLINFGWGRPIWVGTSTSQMKNTFHLLDNPKSGGIEALVTLEESNMSMFEKVEELLKFAALNSTAIDD